MFSHSALFRRRSRRRAEVRVEFEAAARSAQDGLSHRSDEALFKGLEKLGLKLEKHKRSEPVFVIDRLEEKATEN